MRELTEKRRALILDELERRDTIRVAELSARFGVSKVSIRRDIQQLEKEGMLRRVHGGAAHLQDDTPDARNHSFSAISNLEQKRRIGRAAAALVTGEHRIILDSGSTAHQVAAHLPESLLRSGKLSVITASLPVVNQLATQKDVHLIVLGGVFLPEYQVMVGTDTLNALRGLHADVMFLGTDGLTFSQGVTTANLLEAEVDRAMVHAASRVIVVADSSKICGIGLANIMPLTEIDVLVTDTDAPADFVAQLRAAQVEVILA
jgi:DeoR/GlpR family transcriptional regulator of sugar metabolism